MKRDHILGLLIILLIGGCLALGIVSIITQHPDPQQSATNRAVRIIKVYGFIDTAEQALLPPWMCMGASAIQAELRAALADHETKTIILHIDSPGGAVAAIQAIGMTITEVTGQGKPVIAAIDDVAAAGAYYLASFSDKIVALPGSLIGGCGVFAANQQPELEQALTDLAQQYWETIMANRSGLLNAEAVTAASGLLTGRQALELGLIDALGDLNTALTVAGAHAGLPTPILVRPDQSSLSRGLLAAIVHSVWRPKLNRVLNTTPNAFQAPALYFHPLTTENPANFQAAQQAANPPAAEGTLTDHSDVQEASINESEIRQEALDDMSGEPGDDAVSKQERAQTAEGD